MPTPVGQACIARVTYNFPHLLAVSAGASDVVRKPLPNAGSRAVKSVESGSGERALCVACRRLSGADVRSGRYIYRVYGNASAMGTAPMLARIVRPRCRSSPPAKMRLRAI